MSFLNLTSGEFFVLLGALGGLITALYLLDRTRRRKVVSTLRFWNPALATGEQHSRRRMREPWSLVLQLLGLLLLLLAMAQLQLGTRLGPGLDHVLLLDTSSWTAERIGSETLLDVEKQKSRVYLAALSPRDRVLILRADGLATPATSFTSDRAELSKALTESTPGWTALNIEQALFFATQAQRSSGGRRGEIVYIGPAEISDSDLPSSRNAGNLRTIVVPLNPEHCGIRGMSIKRNEGDPNSWQAAITLKNYGENPHTVQLRTEFAGTRFAPRTLTLKPKSEVSAEYSFTTTTSGALVTAIAPAGSLPSDTQASIQLPAPGVLRIAVYTDRPAAFRPLLEANHRLQVKFFSTSQGVTNSQAQVLLFDRFAPPHLPNVPSLWIDPPKTGSPLPVKELVSEAVIRNWHSESALTNGLRAGEIRIPLAEVFQTFADDIPVGSVDAGPIVVARAAIENRPKLAVVGFDPLDGPLRFEVTTPLLFANLLRWLSPDLFRNVEVSAGHAGDATVTLDPGERASDVQVTDQKGFAVPFSIRDRSLQLFASAPSVLRIVSNDRERVLALTLPEIADQKWNPAAAAGGLPSPSQSAAKPIDIWQWLALSGALVLSIEWLLFGRRARISRSRKAALQQTIRTPAARERELAAK